MNLTERQRLILLACLSYAYSNTDDLNEAMSVDADKIRVGESLIDPITEREIDLLMQEI